MRAQRILGKRFVTEEEIHRLELLGHFKDLPPVRRRGHGPGEGRRLKIVNTTGPDGRPLKLKRR